MGNFIIGLGKINYLPMRMILNISENNEFMRLLIFKLFALVATSLLCTFAGSSQTQNVDFMKVASMKIQVDDKLCYSVMKGLSRRDTTKLEPFCGDFVFLRQIDRYKYENGDYFVVEKYDICADTIFVKQVYERWHKDRIPKKIKK